MGLRHLLSVCTLAVLMLALIIAAPASGQSTRAPAPDAPVNLHANPDTDVIHLSWSPPPNPGDSPVTAYIVYRGESPGGVTYLTELNGTNYDDGSVAAGTMYYYQVSARNMAGEGPKSSVVSASINAGTWTLSGRVSGSESGDGIADARLFFERQGPSQGSKETRTDGSGNYNIALEGGNYRVVIEADDHESREEHITLNGDQVMDFRLDEKNGGKEDFNLSKILGIDEEKVEKVARTAGVIAGIYLCSIPLMLFIVVVLLFLTFLRLGKIKKELRAKNEMEGIFISKRRQKKLEKEKRKEEEKVVEDKKERKKGK